MIFEPWPNRSGFTHLERGCLHLSYPERPTCHGEKPRFAESKGVSWETREAKGSYGVNLRHCSYCGSLHPEDLLKALENGAKLEMADWKYGWPHKFYVSGIPNPMVGEIVEMGGKYYTENGIRKHEPFMEPAPQTLTKKFYNEHLIDLTGTPEFDLVADIIRKHSGIKFTINDGKLYYQCGQNDLD